MGRFSRHRSGNNATGSLDTRSNTSFVSSEIGSYAPPSSPHIVAEASSGDIAAAVAASGNGGTKDVISSFVTQPPKPAKGLTGKISTLFRRESSKERNDQKIEDLKCPSAEMSRSASTLPSVGSQLPKNLSIQNQHLSIMQDADNSELYSHSNHSRDLENDASAVPKTPQISVRSSIQGDNDDEQSVGAISFHSRTGSMSKRIFYSSNQDDDSDDSYESRVSRASRGSRSSRDGARDESANRSRRTSRRKSRSISIDSAGGTTFTTDGDDDADESDIYSRGLSDVQSSGIQAGGIRRFRGFSTSIRSLFLDEPLVCAAMGCFGLVLSNRTEYLLQLRNERRGMLDPRREKKAQLDARKKSPSKIVGFGLVITLVLMFTTFIVWGFGSGGNTKDTYLNEYMNGYDNVDGGTKQYWDDYLSKDDDRFGNRNYKRSKNDNDQYDSSGYDSVNDDNSMQNGDSSNYNGNSAQSRDDYYNAADDDERRLRVESLYSNSTMPTMIHCRTSNRPIRGIFKIRDFQLALWDPVNEYLRYELKRPDEKAKERFHIRRIEENVDTDDSSDNGSELNSSSDNNSSQPQRDIASDIRVALLFTFLLFLGILGRRRRMRTRFYLVRARAQDDHLYYASSDEAAARRVGYDDSREDQYEGACSHTLCGCYPIDESDSDINDQEVKTTDSGIFKFRKRPHQEDIVARCFNCFMCACCGAIFKCWFQCLSICALAQEAREIRLLVPPRYQRIDYITHQPFHEYQEAVNDLRRGWLGHGRKLTGLLPHYNALSRFSRWILVLSILSVSIICATLYFNPRAGFSWQDLVVLMATFFQSFLVLFIVHGIFHKSDLSFDAVIKMFTAGFMVAVPSAFFFEGLIVNIALFLVWIFYYVLAISIGENFEEWTIDHFTVIWFIGELFNAYVVAALVEELCKYYTFRAVEHPDLIFLTGLHRDKRNETAVDGGLAKYPFASHQVQELAREATMDDASSTSSYRSNDSKRVRRSRKLRNHEALIEKTGTTEFEFEEDENDIRTHRQKAMAITTAMISVAVGLSCAENFLYVFVMGGALGSSNGDSEERKDDLIEAWIVLFFRSIFPVHALAAALQSINVIRKLVENEDHNGHRIGVGRIVLPAVILHGSFDAVLMCINVFIESANAAYLEKNGGKVVEGEEPYNSLVVNLVAWISIVLILIVGLLWYFKENRKQRARLIILEECEKNARAEALGGAKASVKHGTKSTEDRKVKSKSRTGKSKKSRQTDNEYITIA
jgi:hypothetical protein